MTTTPETKTETPGQHWLDLANQTDDPLQCIAMALTGLLDVTVKTVDWHAREESEQALVMELDEELVERDGTIAAVRAAVGKSTAGWADKIRAALGDDQAEEPTPAIVRPDRDASVEEWREHAVSVGIDQAEVAELNRSQIRTLLGISNG